MAANSAPGPPNEGAPVWKMTVILFHRECDISKEPKRKPHLGLWQPAATSPSHSGRILQKKGGVKKIIHKLFLFTRNCHYKDLLTVHAYDLTAVYTLFSFFKLSAFL